MTHRYLCYPYSQDRIGEVAISSKLEYSGGNEKQNAWLIRECAKQVDFQIEGVLIIPVLNPTRSNTQ